MDIRTSAVMTKDTQSTQLRVATYNIHKCTGLDRRTSPERIISILREIDADVFCLQEVLNVPMRGRKSDQLGQIAEGLPEYTSCFGANRSIANGTYGNLTLSRLPVVAWKNIDITHKRERRGVLRTDLTLAGDQILHVFNTHLGTGFLERRHQAARLIGRDILGESDLGGSRLVVGDFNEWVSGLTTKLLRASFQTFQPRHVLGLPKTFPGLLPFATLDHIYFEVPLMLVTATLWRSKMALVASDHLPLLAEFALRDPLNRVETQQP